MAGRKAGRQTGSRRRGKLACIISHTALHAWHTENSTTLPLPHSLPQSQQEQMLCLIGFWSAALTGLEWQRGVGAGFGFAFAFTALCMARGRKTTKMYAVPAELQI